GLAGVIDSDLGGNLVLAGGNVHRPVVRDRGIYRRLDRGGVVMRAVADRTVTLDVDPRAAGTHQHVAIEGGGAGRRQGREIARRLRERRGQGPGTSEQGDGTCDDTGEPHSCLLTPDT